MVKRCPYCGEPEFPPCEKCGAPLYQDGTRHLKSTGEIKKSFWCKACGKNHYAYTEGQACYSPITSNAFW